MLGSSPFFNENLVFSSILNKMFSHNVITFLITLSVLLQVRINFLKTIKGINFHFL